METGYESAANLRDLPDNAYVVVSVADRSVLLAKLNDGVFATENLCSHASSELAGGRFRHGRISCPLHGVMFDFRTGQVLGGQLTRTGLRTFDTRVDEDGLVWISTTPNEPLMGIKPR